MIKRVQGWKLYPRTYRDEELIRNVTSDPDATPLERELALRMDRLLYHCDAGDEPNPTQTQLF